MDPLNQEKIKQEAKELMTKFSKSLSKVKFKKKEPKKQPGGFRQEGPGLSADPKFRKLFFANAPKTEGDFLIAEKKTW